MTPPRWCAAGLFSLIVALVLAGCKRQEQAAQQTSTATGAATATGPGPKTGPPPGMPAPLALAEPHLAGKKVFNNNACFRCHTVGAGKGGAGDGPPGGPPDDPPGMGHKGPDLGKVAQKEGHNVEWFIAYVSNPRATRLDSKMPGFEKQIQPADMKALAEFLASLK